MTIELNINMSLLHDAYKIAHELKRTENKNIRNLCIFSEFDPHEKELTDTLLSFIQQNDVYHIIKSNKASNYKYIVVISKKHIKVKYENFSKFLYEIDTQSLYYRNEKCNEKKSVFFQYIEIMLKDLLAKRVDEFGNVGNKNNG